MSVVVDASILVAVTTDAGAAGSFADRLLETDDVVAPHLVLVEATNVIRRLEILAQAELSRLHAARKLDPFRLSMMTRFLCGTFIGFMDWWMREENDQLPAEVVDHAFRSLVLPGVSNVLGLDIELPTSL